LGWPPGVGGLGIALLVPQSRKFLIEAGKAALDSLKKIGTKVGPVIGHTLHAATKAGNEASENRPALEKALAKALSHRLTLTQAVYRACLLARKPLSVEEIWAAAARDGARSRAKAPLGSVLRALKRHPLLMVLPGDRWQIAATLITSP